MWLKFYQTFGFPLVMKGINVLYLFLVDLQIEFGRIDKKYTNKIKGEFLVEVINFMTVIHCIMLGKKFLWGI